MATIPDTPDIAQALNSVPVSTVEDAARIRAARERLLILHSLGATEEQVNASLRERVRVAELERDARPTVEVHAAALDRIKELEATETALREQIAALRNPPGPYTVPVAVFRGKLIPLRLALLGASDSVRATWAVLLPELDHLTAVYPREEPVAGLLALAVEHGLLNAAQVADIRGE